MNAVACHQQSLAERIAKRRKELKLTRLQLALAVGVVESSVQAWETGRHAPRLTISQTLALCNALQLSLEELSTGLSQTSAA